jgi:ABC-type multidrug transport system fused ATPase/permease subunit
MHLPNTLARWTQARVSLERIRPFLAAEETLVRRNVGEPGEVDSATESAADTFAPVPERTRGEGDAPVAVEFEDVHVWLEGRELLSLPRLLIPLARKTVVVGPVGAGKSLFVQVLTGRLPPTKGRAWLVDAQGGRSPLDEEGTRSRLLAATALVEQEAFLSSDSVAFNVALSEGADEGDVLASLQRAEFAADLAVLPHGLATAVGEGGVSLSGGQKQRVNLARALHARRPFWVLDDPLSALDADTETRLLEMLHSHGGGFLMVTHRLAGAAAFDHVLVLEEGRVVEEGAPAALLSSPRSRFARLMGVAP